jgi:hypothetical protein
MTILVANISSGKGTLGHVLRVIEDSDWEKIYAITTQQGKESFKSAKKVEYILIDENKPTTEITQDITKALKGKINDMEVALNMISGSGKEHMATLSALLKLGLGVRFIVLTKEGVREL